MNSRESLENQLSTAVIGFHETVAARLGLSGPEWKCLSTLGLHGPMKAGALATATGFTTGAITGIVDRLASHGLVKREPHPTDRRSVLVRAVEWPEGQKEVEQIFGSLRNEMSSVMARFDKTETAAITEYLSETIRVLRSESAKLGHKQSFQSYPATDSERTDAGG